MYSSAQATQYHGLQHRCSVLAMLQVQHTSTLNPKKLSLVPRPRSTSETSALR